MVTLSELLRLKWNDPPEAIEGNPWHVQVL
jgi:hypothetical protein